MFEKWFFQKDALHLLEIKNRKMAVQTVYDHVADFIAEMNPAKLLQLRATDNERERLAELIEKEKQSGLTFAEKDELDHYLVLERLIRLAKAHARQRLAAA